MLRSPILAASRSPLVERLVTHAPGTRGLVRRFVGGADTSSAVATARVLSDAGLRVSLDHLGEDTTDRAHADAVVAAYTDVLTALARSGIAHADVSVKLSAIGQALGSRAPGAPSGPVPDGEKIALENARAICRVAREVGATVTLDMEDHTTTDSTLAVLGELRVDFPETGAVLQAYLHRTEADCRHLATEGSRVRLCKGAYREPASVAFQSRLDVDLSYVRCLNVLMAGDGYPMLATHDPRLIAIGEERSKFHAKTDFEFQMLYGIRPDEQRRLAEMGHTVRVYIPYGAQWYGYLMRRLAERPANLTFFARAMVTKG